MASLVEFLRSGRFGPLATGMSRNTVRDLLGEPTDHSLRTSPEIGKYGSLQLGFSRRSDGGEPVLASIHLAFQTPDLDLPEALEIDEDWVPSGETSRDECRSHLDSVGIPIIGGVATGPDQHFILKSSVRVTFDRGRLHHISYTARREPDNKQLSVTIPKADLEAIGREARARGVSVSALCSQWIVERVSSLQPQ